MIRGKDVECSVLQARPDRVRILGIAWPRRTDVFYALEIHVQTLQVFLFQPDVFRAGLGKDLLTASSRLLDLFHRLAARYEHDDDRYIGQFGMCDGAMGGLTPGDLRMRYRMILRRRLPGFFQLAGHVFDCVVPFGVHHDEGAFAARNLEHVDQFAI
jgi:hypothetical protein